jgi:hypothetical protein
VTAFAHVGKTDLLRQQIDFFVGQDHGGGTYTLRQGADILTRVTPDDTEPAKPSFCLREDEARALLQSLIRHFDGGEDTRSLRKDYDAERARVDKLIDRLAQPPIVIDR